MSEAKIDRLQATLPKLRRLTQARILLGHIGAGLPTRVSQTFLLDHARARQAVWSEVNWDALRQELAACPGDVIQVASLAQDRSFYVRRPDLGRKLATDSASRLADFAKDWDVAIVIGDGLSASAVAINAAPLVVALHARLITAGLSIAPFVLAHQARVAIADPIGEILCARVTIMVIGERPGLSAADSLGIYITCDPATGTPDSRRNCISNVREGGLTIARAADEALALVLAMRRTGVSGVALKNAMARLDGPSGL